MKIIILALWAIFTGVMFCGCKTDIHPVEEIHPAPTVSFGNFNQVDLKGIVIAKEYAASGANQKAVAKINLLLQEKISVLFPPANASATGQTLLIEPEVLQIKFIGGAGRFWAGAMAGSSAVLMKVRFIDKTDGRVLAEPVFYSKSSAASGAYSVGGNDNAMLHRIASEVAAYVTQHKTAKTENR